MQANSHTSRHTKSSINLLFLLPPMDCKSRVLWKWAQPDQLHNSKLTQSTGSSLSAAMELQVMSWYLWRFKEWIPKSTGNETHKFGQAQPSKPDRSCAPFQSRGFSGAHRDHESSRVVSTGKNRKVTTFLGNVAILSSALVRSRRFK